MKCRARGKAYDLTYGQYRYLLGTRWLNFDHDFESMKECATSVGIMFMSDFDDIRDVVVKVEDIGNKIQRTYKVECVDTNSYIVSLCDWET